MPIVSVIMSVYQERSWYVRQAIDSILNQTFSDFEFLIYNDNPQDIVLDELINSYVAKDDRIRYFRNEKNLGLAVTLNRGILVAQGKYIARMDADDISVKNRLAMQVKYLDAKEEVVVLGTWANFIDEKGHVFRNVSLKIEYEDILSYAICDSPVFHPSVMMRREYLLKNQLFYNECFLCAQDYELWSRILFQKQGKIENLPFYLLQYRFSSDQISVKKKKLQEYNGLIIRRNNVSILLSEYGIALPSIITKNDVRKLINSRGAFVKDICCGKVYVSILFLFYMSIHGWQRVIELFKRNSLFTVGFSVKQIIILVLSIFLRKRYLKYSLNE
ncbi:glycosyltransferase [Bacteroides sp.]